MGILTGLNPSFRTWISRYPLDNNLAVRARDFERFGENGLPLGELSTMDGRWPKDDGQWNGIRVLGSMGGTFIDQDLELEIGSPKGSTISFRLTAPGGLIDTTDWLTYKSGQPQKYRLNQPLGNGMLTVQWKGRVTSLRLTSPTNHRALALARLRKYKPAFWRTLDHQQGNVPMNWELPRVKPADLLQGSLRGCALELQIADAKALDCPLWWTVPPRGELSPSEWSDALIEYLEVLKAKHTHWSPVLQLGNEEWNRDFAFARWLLERAQAAGTTWPVIYAREFRTLQLAIEHVYGVGGGTYPQMFLGGHIASPWSIGLAMRELQRLGARTPDMAGPALYIGPTKADSDRWNRFDIVPSQDELMTSCMARLADARADLRAHKVVLDSFGVPKLALYEAGLGLLAGNEPWRQAAVEFHASPKAGDVYMAIRALAESEGVYSLNWYSWNTDQNPSDARMNVFGLDDGSGVETPKSKGARGIWKP